MSATGVCPTEDAILALLDYLVEPMLPSKSSSIENPPLALLQSVAKQMHAVVLLYNYYHRKQHPHLEFLSFEAFCKLAVVVKPALLSHMKLMQSSDDIELENPEKQLSPAEKAIMDACGLATCLYTSKDENIEGWPLSKVAVFLIDSKKEHCHLLFSSITQGVWSVIEQNLDTSECQPKSVEEEKHVNKKKRVIKKPSKEGLVVVGTKTQQLAYSAVKEATGINQHDLKILESHVAYSLSKEKSAVYFYMMQCTRSATEDVIQVPIKDAVDSLQDSLFKKNGRRWSVTSKVEYYHILPYVKMVLTWFRRETLTDNLGVVGGEKIDENLNKPKRKDVTRKLGTQNNQDDATTNNMNKGTSIYDAGLERLPNKTNCMSSLHDAICRPQSPSVDDLVPSNPMEKRKGVPTPTQVIMSYVKKIHGSPVYNHYEATIPCSVTGRQVYNHYEATIPCTVNESKASESGIKVEDGILATNPCIAECSGEKVASGNLSDNISDQNRNDDHALITCQSNTKNLSKMQAIISKETALSQAAIKALIRKRDKLSHQQRIIEDEIAQCDKNMQTILRGDEDDFVVKLDSVIECCNDVCLRSAAEDKPYQYSEENCSSQLVTRKRLSEEILCIRNPCQELDDICHKNNWILPVYGVSSSDGGFQANVILKGLDFEYSSNGEVCHNPREARESAAMKMLGQLWRMAASQP
ncbi:uncharacterized protein LOC111436360 isoform X2 [Cucurbita moschata]|uniref:Uncharacterized protein LOC111436360 isoform X2 n=1 Tax=Cucurbita moschata TaxID=3662 RepID=A0A6J1EQ29_CUCMO|nr:uncharacterized protein LOC111436360 isoform X2 [Cucurbita moschata]